jgi:exodeoxyribonuclease VII small subunit
MKNKNNNKLSFESNLKKLEEIVEQLESGNVDLEKSVELYEKGVELKNICEEKLKK